MCGSGEMVFPLSSQSPVSCRRYTKSAEDSYNFPRIWRRGRFPDCQTGYFLPREIEEGINFIILRPRTGAHLSVLFICDQFLIPAVQPRCIASERNIQIEIGPSCQINRESGFSISPSHATTEQNGKRGKK